jgi:hypothetical protein
MSWNYRVVKFDGGDEDFFEIKEVYYNEKNELEYFGDAVVVGDTIEEMWSVMARFETALKQAPIDGKVFQRESDPDIIF